MIKWFLLSSFDLILFSRIICSLHNSLSSAFSSTSSVWSILYWSLSASLLSFTSSFVMSSSSSLNFCCFSYILLDLNDKRRRQEGLRYQTEHFWLMETEQASKYQAWMQAVFSEFACLNINDSMRHGLSCWFPFYFFRHGHWTCLSASLILCDEYFLLLLQLLSIFSALHQIHRQKHDQNY